MKIVLKGVNLVKRMFGFGKVSPARQLIGESKNGIKVFRFTRADGTVVTQSERLGHLYKTVEQTPMRDIQGGASRSLTSVLNHESGIATRIEKTKNVLLSPEQCISHEPQIGFWTRQHCITDGGAKYNLMIPKAGRYNVVKLQRNDFSPNVVREACYVVGKDGTTGAIIRTNTSSRYGTNQVINQFQA